MPKKNVENSNLQLIRLVRLTATMLNFAANDPDGIGLKSTIKAFKRAEILQKRSINAEKIHIILMHVTRNLNVTKYGIENDLKHNDQNLYSKMFTYVLFNEVADLSQYTIARYFEINRTTVKRHIDKFYKMQAEETKSRTEEKYFKIYEKTRNAILSDIELIEMTSTMKPRTKTRTKTPIKQKL